MERKAPQPSNEVIRREVKIDQRGVNVENRTVELAFSSETKDVSRWYGVEILDHAPASVRLGRLNDGAAVLVNHDYDKQVGVVESAKIDGDRVGRAVVRFGKGAEADAIFQDIIDGIRTKVSVGYMVHSYYLEGSDESGDTYRVNDWEPIEISIVSVPADNSVGVGRSGEPTKTQQPEKREIPMDPKATAEPAATPAPAQAPAPVQVDVRKIEQETRAAEMKRINDIEAIGQKFAAFGGVELARKHMAEGLSVDALNAAILERAGSKKAVPTAEIGLTEREVGDYSFVRVMHALANPKDQRAQEAAAFELAASTAAADKMGKAARGIMIPVDVLRAQQKRDLTVGTTTAGGFTVATELLAGSFIDLLRNRMALPDLGATVLNGLVGNIAIPRQTSGATAYWVAESSAPTESQQAVDQVTMTPKTVGAFTDYSRKLLLQSSIDVENMVRGDLAKVLALAIDEKALYGDGTSNTPTGIKSTVGINTQDQGAATPTWAEVVACETLVAADNADIGSLGYLTNATQRGALKSALVTATYGDRMIWSPDGTLNGYKAAVSNQVASGDLFFGNWADLVIGFWSGLDLMVDPYAGATSGTVRVIALQDVDVAVRHAVSFCRSNNTL